MRENFQIRREREKRERGRERRQRESRERAGVERAWGVKAREREISYLSLPPFFSSLSRSLLFVYATSSISFYYISTRSLIFCFSDCL